MRADGTWRSRSLAVLLLLGPTYAFADDPEISLGVGTQKIVSMAGLQRVAVGESAVADVKVLGQTEVLVVGMGEGLTTLLMWRETGEPVTYRLRVHRYDGCSLGIRELSELLGNAEEIDVRMVGDDIYLEGVAHTAQDLLRVHQVTTQYPNVHSFVKASLEISQLTERRVSVELEKRGLKHVHVSVVGSTIFLEGSVESEEDRVRAERITLALIDS